MDNIVKNNVDVDAKCKLYEQAKAQRSYMEPDYRMAAAYALPRQYNDWTGEGPVQGQTQTAARRYQYDSTGVRSLPKYTAILNMMLTPQGSRWHKLRADDSNLMKIHSVREYFDELNNLLFKMRYDPQARFMQAAGEVYTGLGVYGMGPMSITWGAGMNGRKTMKYKAWPMKDIFILCNDEGEVTHVFRRFWLNARQFKLKWPTVRAPRTLAAELEKTGGPDENKRVEFVQVLWYRDDYNPEAISKQRHRVRCDYICYTDKEAVDADDAYSSMPILTPRVYTEAGNPYGYSPAMQALSSMGAASSIKKTTLKMGHKALDPSLLAADDGVLSGRVDIRPGRVTYGAVNSQGQPLVHALKTGDFQPGKELLQDERSDIEDAFFVKLFTILADRPQMTATQVVEEIGQKAGLLAPTMGRLQSEFGGPDIEREIGILTEVGLRPDMPQELIDAAGDYNIVYTSPMAKALYNEDVAGAMRWIEFSLNYAEASQDPSVLDRVNIKNMQPEIADHMNVPTRWVCSDDEVKQKGAERQQRQDTQQIVDQAPAIASVANATMKREGTSNAKGMSN